MFQKNLLPLKNIAAKYAASHRSVVGGWHWYPTQTLRI
jgi:hypothetical protein